jgi:hypothetical protein
MTVSLDLKPEVEAKLIARARAKGVPLDAYLRDAIEDLAKRRTRQLPISRASGRPCWCTAYLTYLHSTFETSNDTRQYQRSTRGMIPAAL